MQPNNNIYTPVNLNQINNHHAQPQATKNYDMMQPKEPTHVFITILLYLVTAVVFFGAGYVTRMWQDTLTSDTNTSTNQSPNFVDNDTKNWDTYTYDLLDLSINHPTSWTVTETNEEINGCTAITIKFTNGEYVFVIDSACNAKLLTCTYNNSSETGNDILSFNEFTEIASDSTSYRRALNSDNNFTICAKPQNKYLSYTVPFGYITYEVPENYSNDMIAIMDHILLSLVNTPAGPDSNIISTGCTSENIQYNTGDTFENECNTCTCNLDGTIDCTTEECIAPTEDI